MSEFVRYGSACVVHSMGHPAPASHNLCDPSQPFPLEHGIMHASPIRTSLMCCSGAVRFSSNGWSTLKKMLI